MMYFYKSFAPFVFCLFFYSLYGQVQKKEKWRVASTSILITSNAGDKIALHKACRNKYILVFNDSLVFNTSCLFGEIIRGKFEKFKTAGYQELSSCFDNDRLMEVIVNNCPIKNCYLYSTAKFKLKDGTIDSCNIIVNDLRNKMILFYDPYVICLRRMQ